MSTGITYVDAVILGVVEGLSEFLPISSTGHLTIAEKFMGLQLDNDAIRAFTAVIQVPAIIATIIFFWKDIARLAVAWGRGLVGAPARREHDYRFAWYVIAGSIPIVIIGLALKPLLEGPLGNLWIVAVALIGWSGVMVLAETRGSQTVREKDLTLRQSMIIGLTQCVALIPGISRSGATISAGLLQGLDRIAATRLSFFLAIPALTGAGLLELVKLGGVDHSVVGWGPLIVACVVSFVVAYASIAWLLRFLAKHPITVFVYYRIPVGIILIILLWTGALSPT